MSRRCEYEIQCPTCGKFFRGEGRGPARGEQLAIDAAILAWGKHECTSNFLVMPRVRFTRMQLDSVLNQITQLLPGVTFHLK